MRAGEGGRQPDAEKEIPRFLGLSGHRAAGGEEGTKTTELCSPETEQPGFYVRNLDQGQFPPGAGWGGYADVYKLLPYGQLRSHAQV